MFMIFFYNGMVPRLVNYIINSMLNVSWRSVVDKTLAPLSRGRAFETQVVSLLSLTSFQA